MSQHQHQHQVPQSQRPQPPQEVRPPEQDFGSNEAQQNMLRPKEQGNSWIPDFLEPATDWIGEKWDAWWATDEEQAEEGAAPAADVLAPAPASAWWEAYRSTRGRDARKALVVEAASRGEMDGHFQALSAEQRSGEWRFPFQQALDLYQLFATEQASGRTLEQMGKTQADYMTAEDERVAGELAEGDEITPEALEQAQERRLEQDYNTEPEGGTLEWPDMNPAEREAWMARGEAAKATLLTHLREHHPDFAITDDQIVFDFERVEAANAVAFNDGEGHCYIGEWMVRAIEANPAFAVSTVAHELFGHNEFNRGFSVSEELFKQAIAPQRGVEPRDVVLTPEEWTRFNYFESEIASIVWEYELWVGSDEEGRSNPMDPPAKQLERVLENLRGQWAPELVEPLMQGLHARFVADPGISDAAAQFFADGCAAHLGTSP